MSIEMLQLVQLMESHRLEVSKLEAENAELQQERDDYAEVLRYVKNNKSGHGFRINGIFKKWSDD